MILNNRLVLVAPVLPDGSPAPGYHVNVDPRIFTDPATAASAQGLLAAVAQYVVKPKTPQFVFEVGQDPVCLCFPDEATALAIGEQVGVSDGVA